MELTAVIKALETLQVPCRVSLYSDSQYVVNMIAKKWINRWAKNGWRSYNIMTGKKKEIKNIDLIKRLYELLQFHQVDAVWVKAHADNNLNNFVDTLARKANDALCRTL
jgi:ribonuclease HI